MKRIAVVAGLLLSVGFSLLIGAYFVLKNAYSVPPPLAGYTEVTATEADAIGKKVAEGFSAGDSTAFDEAFDLDAVGRAATAGFTLTRGQRQEFLDGFRKGVAKGPGGTYGKALLQGVPAGSRAKLLRSQQRDGHREAVVRMRVGEGVNYFGLLVARDPAGRTRIVNLFNYLTGELTDATFRTLLEAMSGDLRRSPLERFLSRMAQPGTGADKDGDSDLPTELPKVRQALMAGKNAEALEAWKRLPEAVRSTRGAWLLRLMAAQNLGDDEYQKALAEIDARFPGDPTLAFVQIDRHVLRKDWRKALECIDILDKAIGGDPYLAVTRTAALLELGKADEAKARLTQSIAQEPDLVDLWWGLATVSLRQRDHAETKRLLLEIQKTFKVHMNDLKGNTEYAEFVRSPEYKAWLASKRATEASDESEQEADSR